MSKRDHNLFLEDMLDAIEAISRYTKSLDINSFIDDRKTVDAVIRNLEILGEAASQVPESFKNKSVITPAIKTAKPSHSELWDG